MKAHYDIDAEQTLLANGLRYGSKAWRRITRSMPDIMALWRPGHRHVAQAITDAMADGEPACVATAVAELLGQRTHDDSEVTQLDHLGGYAELAKIAAQSTASSDVAPARRVWELYRRRCLVAALERSKRAADQPASDVDAIATSLSVSLRDGLPQNPGMLTAIADIGQDTDLERVPRARWGIHVLDEAAPWHRQTMTLIAAPPGGGKTTLACWVAVQAASAGCKVGFVSLEMSDKQIASWVRKCQRACGTMAESNIVVKKSVLTHAQVGAAVREMADAGCDLVIVDHVQKIKSVHPAEKIFDTVSKASAALNDAANQCNIAVIACCQVSGASRKPVRNKTGQVSGAAEVAASDLRGSGDLEQDAAVIVTVWREDSDDTSATPVLFIKIAKNRFGSCAKFQVRVDFRDCTFGSVDRPDRAGRAERPQMQAKEYDKDFDPFADFPCDNAESRMLR